MDAPCRVSDASTPRGAQALRRLAHAVGALAEELRDRASANCAEFADGAEPNWYCMYDNGNGEENAAVSAGEENDAEGEEYGEDGAAATPAPLHPSNGETYQLQWGRWAHLHKDFYKPKKANGKPERFDTTKIPDIYDNAVYDSVHNAHLEIGALAEVLRVSHTLASYVVPQEYGIEAQDKVGIGLDIASSMLRKVPSAWPRSRRSPSRRLCTRRRVCPAGA